MYNPATGFLSDSSGFQLFYTSQKKTPVSKLLIGHRSSNKLMVMPEVSNWRVRGLCKASCLGDSVLNVTSVSLHAGRTASDVRLVSVPKLGEGPSKTLVSGFRRDFQPTRQLDPPMTVTAEDSSLVVDCFYSNPSYETLYGGMGMENNEECFAVLTVTPRIDILKCVSEPDKSSFEKSFSMEFKNFKQDMEAHEKSVWANISEEEKNRINFETYNNKYATFCTKEDLTKNIEAGVTSPESWEITNEDGCKTSGEKRRGRFLRQHQHENNGSEMNEAPVMFPFGLYLISKFIVAT